MKSARLLVAISGLLVLASCIRTLNPLFENKQLVFEPQLIGKWVNKDSSSYTIIFRCKNEDSACKCDNYKMVIIEKNKEGQRDTVMYIAMTGLIGKNLFLDLFPDNSDNSNECFNNLNNKEHYIPAHTFYKIIVSKDSLELVQMDYKWFKKNVKKSQVPYIMQSESDFVTVIATTKELQALCRKYGDNKDAFPREKEALRRVE